LFISRQIPIDVESGEIADESVDQEARQVMNNLAAVLNEADMNFSNVIKTTIFLTDMEYFQEVNAIYAKYFSSDFPASETIAVKALPKGARVEISAIASKEPTRLILNQLKK